MTEILQSTKMNLKSAQDEYQELLHDIDTGLSQTQKQIPSKLFYDEIGCEIFNQITRHPDYYLTNAEIEILNTYKTQIAAYIGQEPFNLVELGPGEGLKTNILIKEFLKQDIYFTYSPIDISQKYLNHLIDELLKQIPELNIAPIRANYFHGLAEISEQSNLRKIVVFLGSSIGNFNLEQTQQFLFHLWENLNRHDLVLIGFDLCHDEQKLMQAYDDNVGITREFNLNLLRRLNRELEANFSLENFEHIAYYDKALNAMESFLISLVSQDVHIGALNKDFHFEAQEKIHVEYSFKYHLAQIQELAQDVGFEVLQHFMDKNNQFVDSLWKVIK